MREFLDFYKHQNLTRAISSHSALRKHVLEDDPSPMPTGHAGEPRFNSYLKTHNLTFIAYRLMVRHTNCIFNRPTDGYRCQLRLLKVKSQNSARK